MRFWLTFTLAALAAESVFAQVANKLTAEDIEEINDELVYSDTAAALGYLQYKRAIEEDDAVVVHDTHQSQPGGYAPYFTTCPTSKKSSSSSSSSSSSKDLVRNATSLSSGELEFLEGRRAVANDYLVEYLDRLNMTDFNATDFLQDTNITIGLAFSGGGFRAMLSGAGFLAAFDDRTPNATDSGHIGGLLQSSTYIAGLSGGSWLVSSFALNGFVPVVELQGDENIWDISSSLLNPDGFALWDTAEYYTDLIDWTDDKSDLGFNLSLTDFWGLGLALQLLNTTDMGDDGPNATFSSIQNISAFSTYAMPMPIVVADGRPYNTDIVSLNSTVYEFNPFEMGSWDPSLYAFAPTEYLGTNMTNGVPLNESVCVRGFDNGAFVMGTSATLFNDILLELNSSGLSGVLYTAVHSVLTDLSEDNNDIAPYEPNPFYGVNPDLSYMDNETILNLVDGGEDYENIPLHPLIQPIRGLDVVFAVDNSADTDYNWPAGWAMTATYDRQFGDQANGTKFPAVPDMNTFVGYNLTAHPTWFGCNSSNITGENGGTTVPLIVYLANHPISYYSNTSTYKLSYSEEEMEGMITNGYNVATQGNGTIDDEWSKCLGCAIIHREVERRNQTHTSECQACLDTYCWDGTVLSQNASEATEEPEVEVSSDNTGAAGILTWREAQWGVVALAMLLAASM
ncbi:lysophospholipase catalytic domain-containing protein [Lipomyces oligophaga]|uniref:lysophospholipase catalytic domain-containing protein n=1 Tax=Lipomyces oligophaga TaxID=45792 RepID=UPI0034CF758A